MTFKYSGIDISKWQDPKKVDWAGLARSHDFVILRACYGVKSDWAFVEHFQQARSFKVLVGAYIFYRQTQGWCEQYDALKGELDRVGFGEGDILPVVDLEWNEDYDGPIRPRLFNTDARMLVEKLARTYGGCIVYLSPGFYAALGKPAWLLNFPWWVSHHDVKEPLCPWTEWIVWQYTSKGKSPAYFKGVDLNWAKKLPPVVDLVPDIEDHKIPDISKRDPYGEAEPPPGPEIPTPVLFPPVVTNVIDEEERFSRSEPITVPSTPAAKRSWIQRLVDWLRAWILLRNGK